jgi:hypothetical protein
MMDPTFLWFLRRLKGPPEIIIILQDWYLEEKTVGTVEESLEYIDKCYNKVHVKPDSTFLYLFQTYWSRCLIDDGRCLVVNAAWGIRRKKEFTKATGYLGKELHMIAREKLWLWVVEEIQPNKCG